MSAGTPQLDFENPWPGLAAYDEASTGFFHGRTTEASELLRLVRLNPLTALYGKSGLGKTSLLQAGLFPLLRAEHFLPVHIRLEFSETAPNPLAQVLGRLVAELHAVKADHPTPRDAETLWEYLHRLRLELWSEQNFRLKPVLVFDQFEELFSRAGKREVIASVFDSLADLIENRLPTELTTEAAAPRRANLDLLARRYHVLLAFREDFLPQIKSWELKVPSLLRNYVRLEPMNRKEATKVVERAGKSVVSPGVAPAILDLVARDPVAGDMSGRASEEAIEPVLLSLCCARLNAKRAGAPIDKALVRAEGTGILEAFYREVLADEGVQGLPDVAVFIETYLVQGDRFRGDYPKDAAVAAGLITMEQLTALTDQHRLLRVVSHPDTARIELIHDRLVAVVCQARDERKRERAHREELVRLEQRRKRQILWAALIAAALGVLLAVAIPLMLRARRAEAVARSAESKARAESDRAEWQAARELKLVDQASKADVVAAIEHLDHRDQALAYLARALGYRRSSRVAAEQAVTCLSDRPNAAARMVFGHAGPVNSAVFSADGARVLTTSSDDTARIWDVATGKSPVVLTGHSGLVTGAVFSPDGTRVLTASGDDTARVWDAATGKSLAVLTGHAGAVYSAVFSAEGARVLTAAKDQTARIWDAATGKSLVVLTGHAGAVYSAAFSADGERVLTAAFDDTARIWDSVTGKSLVVFSHLAWFSPVVFSADGERVLTVARDRTARIWSVATGKSLFVLTGHAGAVNGAVFSADGASVLTTSGDNTVEIWDSATGRSLVVLTGHSGLVRSAVFSADGARVLTASEDQTVRIWDSATGRSLVVLTGHSGPVDSAVFSADGARVLTASEDQTARIWDSATSKSLVVLTGHSGPVDSAVFSADGARVLTASEDQTARIWEWATGKLLVVLTGHSTWVTHAVFSADGARVLTASSDGTARIWDSATGRLLVVLTGHSSRVGTAVFSADGTRALTASSDGTARIWDVATGKSLVVLTGHSGLVTHAVFSADGARVLTASSDGTARIWDWATGKSLVVFTGHSAWVTHAVFSADSARVLTASTDNTARIWDVATGKSLVVFTGHSGSLNSAVFSADGARVLTASEDQTARIWDVVTGKSLVVLRGHSGSVNSAEFSADGERALTASNDGAVRIWQLLGSAPPEAPAWFPNLLRVAASRTFSEDGDLIQLTGVKWAQLRADVRNAAFADQTRYGEIGRWYFGGTSQ